MRAPSAPETRLPARLVRNRNFVLLWAAYGISAVGDHLSEMALLVERNALDGRQSVRIQALLSFGFFLPFVLLGPLAGWWADRFSRKWTMIGADLVRAAVMVNLALIVPALAGWLDPHGLGDYSVVIPLMVVGVFAAFFSPSRQAMLPTLIRADQLVRANAMISALGTIGTILSAVIGGYLVLYKGKLWNYRVDAVTFVVSALLLAFISLRATRAVPHPKLPGVWSPIIDGFRYVRGHRRVLQMILLGTVFWAAAGVVVSVVPALVRDVFGGDISDVGIYRGLIGIGLVLGAGVMTVVGPAMPIPLAVLLATAGGGAWVLALDAAYAFKLGRVVSGVCLVMIGAHGAAILVTVMATLQRFVPDARRGRVFGVCDMCTMGAMVAATGALGLPNIPNLDVYIPYLLGATGLGLLATTWLAWREYRRGDANTACVSFIWKLVRFYARFWCRLRREGPCSVPRAGPVIVAANHTAGIDPILILATCTHRLVSFVVAREYYDKPVAGWFMRQNHCIPIDRAHPGKAFLNAALRLLKSGGCLGIFPQGTFERPGEELGPKSGIGVIALRTGATVIPCHISGTRYYDNPFAAFFVRHAVRIRYGKPIDLAPFRGKERDRDTPERISELIMQKIRELAPPNGRTVGRQTDGGKR